MGLYMIIYYIFKFNDEIYFDKRDMLSGKKALKIIIEILFQNNLDYSLLNVERIIDYFIFRSRKFST